MSNDAVVSKVQSTPAKPGLSGAGSVTNKRDSIDDILAADVQDNTFSGLPVHDFFIHAMDFDADAIADWTPSVSEWIDSPDFQEALAEYRTKLRKGSEADLYDPFAKLANLIIKKADERDKNGNPLQIKFTPLGNRVIPSLYAQRKPDVLTVPASMDIAKVNWQAALVAWEFKKIRKKRKINEAQDDDDPFVTSSEKRSKTAGVTGRGSKDVSSRNKGTPNQAKTRTSVSASTSAVNTSNVSESSAAQTPAQLPKKDVNVQVASYVAEMLSSNTFREWTYGVTIVNDNMILRYYDRACSVQTERFEYVGSDLVDFVLLIVALRRCDWRRFGYSQLFEYKDSSYLLPGSKFKPDTPVQQIPDEEATKMNWGDKTEIHFQETKYRSYGIFGRATVVSEVVMGYFVEGVWKDQSEQEKFVVKISWQVKTRQAEVEIIKRARKINSVNTPLVFFAYSCERTLPSEKLRVFFEKNNTEAWEGEQYIKALFEIIRCHWELFEKGNILHRDLSILNLMFQYRADGVIVGILNDFDLAIILNDDKSAPTPSSKHRTGTAPFMSHELLNPNNTVPHLWRHDLESFLYIMVWTSLGYRGFEHPEGRDPLKKWRKGNWRQISTEKYTYLSTSLEYTEVMKYVVKEHISIKSTIYGLRQIFRKALSDAEEVRDNRVNELKAKNPSQQEDKIYESDEVRNLGWGVLEEQLTWEKVSHLFVFNESQAALSELEGASTPVPLGTIQPLDKQLIDNPVPT